MRIVRILVGLLVNARYFFTYHNGGGFMITCTGWRQNGERVNFPVQTFNDPLEALGNLVRAEFNFGCRVLELTERRITTETTVISCVDTTTF
ncbi:MAG: hypothetical protein HYS44_01285, partial [Candidatus Niyogibacteria bacterium]|nr:hypothetical protein [Candidatus Niyogibacteria bacterium]